MLPDAEMNVEWYRQVERIVIVVLFIGMSVKFFKEFGKGEYDDIINILGTRKGLDCPVGFTLYRLQATNSSKIYHIQIQRKPFSKTAKVVYKRCQIFQTTQFGNVSSKMIQRYGADLVEEITVDESQLINKTCGNQNYTTHLYSGLYTESDVSKGVTNSFVNYWFGVVKGPPFEMIQPETESDAWDIRTLIWGIFPGTLWCGFENIADDHYQKLGRHQQTDSCCRSHDLCTPRIKAFQSRFYLHNPSFIPISHCSCDMEFYNCLKKVNSVAANKIGHIFFNLAKTKCFDFDEKEVCSSNFLGVCFHTENQCAAVLRDNAVY